MDISYNTIRQTLQREDIEGLIAIGAPADEYDHEAKTLALTLAALPEAERTQDSLVASLMMVWGKYFELTPQEIAKRVPAFGRVAAVLLS